ncbi:MAG: DUF58 domain-containing protein [Deltaproteobacteria bacterium]|nr:DUF58 domain-containing protein [Deltaproteobacteria bacterium]MBW2396515.1 DUF58 domain-containing protein [Deltaproteobacteria bacterium]
MDSAGDPRAGAGSAVTERRASLGGRLRRSLRPPRSLKPTRAGWCFFALTLGVGFASLNTGNNLLYMVLSVLLGFLVLSGVFSEAALRHLTVRRKLPREVFAGTPATIAYEVRNKKRRVPSYAIVVEDLAGFDIFQTSPAARAFFFFIPGEATVSRIARWTPETRGETSFAGFRVWTRFPFGLFVKAAVFEGPQTVLVYPEPAPHGRIAEGNASDARGEHSSGRAGESPEAAGVRSYAPGDSFRRVHWPHSLRTSSLLVRDREQEDRPELVVTLATARATAGPAFEAEVSRATGQILRHIAEGWRVGLRTDEHFLPPGDDERARREMLRLLAEVQPGSAEKAGHAA